MDLERKNAELDERRRYIETVLERIATGVISLGADGRIETINGAALRLLEVDRSVVGAHADSRVSPRGPAAARDAAAACGAAASRSRRRRRSRWRARAARSTWPPRRRRCRRRTAASTGAVLVFDDVTPLIRTQRVAAWRDVARRLAHEIKNPLTPIQLCAERMRRHFTARAAAGPRAGGGVHVDDRRRGRVAQGAGGRVRAVRADAGAARGAGGPATRLLDRHAGALQRPVPRDPASSGASPKVCRRCGSTSSRSGGWSSTSSTTPSRRSAAAARRAARRRVAGDRRRDAA